MTNPNQVRENRWELLASLSIMLALAGCSPPTENTTQLRSPASDNVAMADKAVRVFRSISSSRRRRTFAGRVQPR